LTGTAFVAELKLESYISDFSEEVARIPTIGLIKDTLQIQNLNEGLETDLALFTENAVVPNKPIIALVQQITAPETRLIYTCSHGW